MAAPNQAHGVLSRCRTKPFQEGPGGGEQRTNTGVLGRECALSSTPVRGLATGKDVKTNTAGTTHVRF